MTAVPAYAGDCDQGRVIAIQCTGCHGTDGFSQGKMPRLTGQPIDYLLQQLHDFRQGKRVGTMMNRVTASYSWDELEAAANYFSKLPYKAP